MSEQEIPAEEHISQFLNDNVKNFVNKDGAFCTNFFMVAEFVDVDGTFYTWTVKNSNVPDWRHEGLLNYAIRNELYIEEESEDGDF